MYLLLMLFLVGVNCNVPSPPDTAGPPGGDDSQCTVMFRGPVKTCDDDLSMAFADTSCVETFMYNETTTMVRGKIEFRGTMGPDTMVEIEMSKMKGMTSTVVFTYMICDFCADMQDENSQNRQYMEPIGFPAQCPIEPGDIHIDNLVADTADMPVNNANKGDYRTVMSIYNRKDDDCKEKTFQACFVVDFSIDCS